MLEDTQIKQLLYQYNPWWNNNEAVEDVTADGDATRTRLTGQTGEVVHHRVFDKKPRREGKELLDGLEGVIDNEHDGDGHENRKRNKHQIHRNLVRMEMIRIEAGLAHKVVHLSVFGHHST